ncbi:hypothetical protein [Olivibacter jilunii]|uniref:hypothetical protein n=1 Tax=Olivibacter jilunii TaxID=985016 RepID=UPI003F16AD3E
MSRKAIWIIAVTLLAVQTWLFCRSTSVNQDDLGTRVVLHTADVVASISVTCLFAAIPTVLIALIPFRKRKYWLKFRQILPISIGCISALLIIISFFSDGLGGPRRAKVVPLRIEKE